MLKSTSSVLINENQKQSKGFKSTIKQILSIQQQKAQKQNKDEPIRPKSLAKNGNFYAEPYLESEAEQNVCLSSKSILNSAYETTNSKLKEARESAYSRFSEVGINRGLSFGLDSPLNGSPDKSKMSYEVDIFNGIKKIDIDKELKKSSKSRSSVLLRKLSNTFIKQKSNCESEFDETPKKENSKVEFKNSELNNGSYPLSFKPETHNDLKKHTEFYNMSVNRLSKPQDDNLTSKSSSYVELPDRRRSLGYATFLKSQDVNDKDISPRSLPVLSNGTSNSTSESHISFIGEINGQNLDIPLQFLSSDYNLRHISSESTIENYDNLPNVGDSLGRVSNTSNIPPPINPNIIEVNSFVSSTSSDATHNNDKPRKSDIPKKKSEDKIIADQNSNSTLSDKKSVKGIHTKFKKSKPKIAKKKLFDGHIDNCVGQTDKGLVINVRTDSSLKAFDYLGSISKNSNFINTEINFSPMMAIDVDDIKSKIKMDKIHRRDSLKDQLKLLKDSLESEESLPFLEKNQLYKGDSIDTPPTFINDFSDTPSIEWKNILEEVGLDREYSSMFRGISLKEDTNKTQSQNRDLFLETQSSNENEFVRDENHTRNIVHEVHNGFNTKIPINECNKPNTDKLINNKAHIMESNKIEDYDESDYGDDEQEHDGFDCSDNDEALIISDAAISEVNMNQRVKPNLIYMKEASYRDFNDDAKSINSDYGNQRNGIENNGVEKGYKSNENFEVPQSKFNVESKTGIKNEANLRFNDRVSVFETFDSDDYDRSGHPAMKITAELAFEIKKELNEYKFYEMPVHKDSVIYTHYIL
ncbi:hypothetical protein AYI68_g6921 [Smittium mucronatum]|uniref:Protein BNI4 n=1 Tax=Smittium mucronatum TaxID=133383 RepID=A0A1R0GQ51_9FUNG|nr:hypothetical protein AYI68_g6921 [Smittium mucronatum]